MRWDRRGLWAGLFAGAICLAPFAGAQTAPPSKWDSWLASARDLQQRAHGAVGAAIDYARPLPRQDGIVMLSRGPAGAELVRTPLADAPAVPARVVILIHGLDEPGSIWDELAPLLVDAGAADGFGAAIFNYPDDQPIVDSALLLARELRALKARGVRRVDLVAHSMGGLVARDVLTRPDAYAGRLTAHTDLPDAPQLILVGSPLAGSPWARLRAVAEMKEQIERWAADKSLNPRQLLGFMNDGDGRAGADLLPGSPYLKDLNSRSWPTGIRVTAIVGTITPTQGPDLSWVRNSAVLRQVMGDEQTDRLAASLDEMAHSLGDGVVSVDSATPRGLPEPADVVRVEGSHRGMLKNLAIERQARSMIGQEPQDTPPAIPVILDRLDAAKKP